MYGGMLPSTGGFVNPLRLIYLLIALFAFSGAWAARKWGQETLNEDKG